MAHLKPQRMACCQLGPSGIADLQYLDIPAERLACQRVIGIDLDLLITDFQYGHRALPFGSSRLEAHARCKLPRAEGITPEVLDQPLIPLTEAFRRRQVDDLAVADAATFKRGFQSGKYIVMAVQVIHRFPITRSVQDGAICGTQRVVQADHLLNGNRHETTPEMTSAVSSRPPRRAQAPRLRIRDDAADDWTARRAAAD